jgi:DNA-binding XRE family transcriptional regulator
VQIIVQNGQPEWAVLPYAEYLALVEEAEMLEDIQDFDTISAAVADGTEEMIPASVTFALAGSAEKPARPGGESPLKIWREHRGYSRQQLAEAVGISLPYLSQIESGKRKASVGVLVRIASILRVEVDDILS